MYKYNFIANDIKKKIETNLYKINDKLPDETTLSIEYNCSRMTIKKAIDILVSEGLITKSRGAGTFIRPHKKDNKNKFYSNAPTTFGFHNTFKNIEHSTKVITFNIIECPKDIANKLQITSENFIYFVERIRYIKKIPIIFETLYIPVDKIPGLSKNILEHSLYEYIEKSLKIRIYNADKFIKAKLADEKDKNFLNANENTPILEMEHIVYSSKNIPIEFAKLHYHGNFYELHFITQKEY